MTSNSYINGKTEGLSLQYYRDGSLYETGQYRLGKEKVPGQPGILILPYICKENTSRMW